MSIIDTEVFNKGIEKERGNYRKFPDSEQGSLLEIVGNSHTECDLTTLCRWSKEPDNSCMLIFIRNTIVLDRNGSLLRDNREEWAVGGQEGLHLVTHGDGLASNCIVRFNVFLAC